MQKSYTSTDKANVAIAAIKAEKTIAEISSHFQIHPTQINRWKSIALKGIPDLFSDKQKKKDQNQQQLIDELYKIIGQRDIELEWLKKKLQYFK